MKCSICEIEFEQKHFNQRYCSEPCKRQAKINSKKKHKKTEKGKISDKRWRDSEKCKELKKTHMQKPEAKRKAVLRSQRCLDNSPELQEKKRLRDIQFGRTEKGREINKKSLKKYRQTVKGKANSKKQKYMRRALGEISQETIIEIQKENNCYYCGKDLNDKIFKDRKTIDHKQPVTRGGTNDKENLVVACQSCNSSKGNKTEKEYRRYKNENNL